MNRLFRILSADDVVDSEPQACEVCGEHTVATALLPRPFIYGMGDSAVELVAMTPVYTCTSCGLEYTNHLGEEAQHAAICRYLDRLTPAEVTAIRKQNRSLSRERFAEVTGHGVATLARWESGGLIQSAANDRYLRLLRQRRNFEELEVLAAGEAQPAMPRPSTERFPNLEVSPKLNEMKSRFQLRAAN